MTVPTVERAGSRYTLDWNRPKSIGQVRASFGGHAIVSEEAGSLAGSRDHCWYIDPLDGTTNYAHGLPIFCASLGETPENVTLPAGDIIFPLAVWQARKAEIIAARANPAATAVPDSPSCCR